MPGQQPNPIGIDLGTTYSCVGVWRNERAEILANDQGNYTTPSCVAFTVNKRLVGEAAVNQAAFNVCNTVVGVKRMIGRTFNEPQIQSDIKHRLFAVKNRAGSPVIEVQYQGILQEFTPTEISAMILIKMKQIAEAKLGPVEDAVITVPAYFDNGQRQATKDAGKIAGLNVLRILSEPTAAALAYGIDSRNYESKTILVYDLGGGTLDVSILTIEGDDFKVLSTSGDTHLGGEDFDTRMVEHFLKEIGIDIRKNMKAMRRLRAACERTKRTLSSELQSVVEIEALYEGIDFQSNLTRAKFNVLCEDLFLSTILFIEKALVEAKLSKSHIDEVVLSGGSSRIPKIQELVSTFFDGKRLNRSINLDEAVAMGASIQANILKGNPSQRFRDIHLEEVTPLSLGVEVVHRSMSIIIEKNSIIPVERTREFTTTFDFQSSALISVYEGEATVIDENILLGMFTLEGIQVTLVNVPRILVTFKIDLDGILHVSAVDKVTNVSQEISISNYRGHLTSTQIDVMAKRNHT